MDLDSNPKNTCEQFDPSKPLIGEKTVSIDTSSCSLDLLAQGSCETLLIFNG